MRWNLSSPVTLISSFLLLLIINFFLWWVSPLSMSVSELYLMPIISFSKLGTDLTSNSVSALPRLPLCFCLKLSSAGKLGPGASDTNLLEFIKLTISTWETCWCFFFSDNSRFIKEDSCFADFVSKGGIESREERRDGFLTHSFFFWQGTLRGAELSFLIRFGGTAISSSSVSMYSGTEALKLSSLMDSGVTGSSALMEAGARDTTGSRAGLSLASRSKSGLVRGEGGGGQAGLSWGDTELMLSTPESDSVSIKSQLWSRDWGSAKYGACVRRDRPGLWMSDNPGQDKTRHYMLNVTCYTLHQTLVRMWAHLIECPVRSALTSQTDVQLQVQVV